MLGVVTFWAVSNPEGFLAKTSLLRPSLGVIGPRLPWIGQTWLEVKVEPEAPLARVPLRAVAFALRATVADSLDCGGCVGAGQLHPAVLQDYVKASALAKVATSGAFADLSGGPDLSAYAKAAGLAKVATTGAFTDLAGGPDLSAYVKAAELAKVAQSGAYKDLSGQPKYADVASTGAYNDLAQWHPFGSKRSQLNGGQL